MSGQAGTPLPQIVAQFQSRLTIVTRVGGLWERLLSAEPRRWSFVIGVVGATKLYLWPKDITPTVAGIYQIEGVTQVVIDVARFPSSVGGEWWVYSTVGGDTPVLEELDNRLTY